MRDLCDRRSCGEMATATWEGDRRYCRVHEEDAERATELFYATEERDRLAAEVERLETALNRSWASHGRTLEREDRLKVALEQIREHTLAHGCCYRMAGLARDTLAAREDA